MLLKNDCENTVLAKLPPELNTRLERLIVSRGVATTLRLLGTTPITLDSLRHGGRARRNVTERVATALRAVDC